MAAVTVIDTVPAYRAGLAGQLRAHGLDAHERAPAPDTEDRAVAAIVVTDRALSGGSLEEVLPPEVPVVVLTTQPGPADDVRALRAGANGVARWDEEPAHLAALVTLVASGCTVLPEGVGPRRVIPPSLPTLPPLEPELLALLEQLAAGRTLADLADELHLGERTLQRRAAVLRQLLEVATTAEAVALYRAFGTHEAGHDQPCTCQTTGTEPPPHPAPSPQLTATASAAPAGQVTFGQGIGSEAAHLDEPLHGPRATRER